MSDLVDKIKKRAEGMADYEVRTIPTKRGVKSIREALHNARVTGLRFRESLEPGIVFMAKTGWPHKMFKPSGKGNAKTLKHFVPKGSGSVAVVEPIRESFDDGW